MEDYLMTTGKDYSGDKTVKCESCGNVYNQAENETCPRCNGKECSPFQRTKASLEDEVV